MPETFSDLVYSLEVCGKMDNLTKITAAGILISRRISGRISCLPNIRYITTVHVVVCLILDIHEIHKSIYLEVGNPCMIFIFQSMYKCRWQESRAIARKPRNTVAVLFDNIHYKFKSSQASKTTLQSSKHTGAKQNLTQNGHSRSFKVTCFGVSGKAIMT